MRGMSRFAKWLYSTYNGRHILRPQARPGAHIDL